MMKKSIWSRCAHGAPFALVLLAFALLAVSPADAAFIDEPEDGLTLRTCHDPATVLLVAGQFGAVLIVSGKSAPILADVAWSAMKKPPPVVNRIYVVMAHDGIVRLYAVNRGCVRRTLVASLPVWQIIIGRAMERFPTVEH